MVPWQVVQDRREFVSAKFATAETNQPTHGNL